MGPSRAQATSWTADTGTVKWRRHISWAAMLAADLMHTACPAALSLTPRHQQVWQLKTAATHSRLGQGWKTVDRGSASAVAARTPATLLSKKLCSSDALISVDGGTRPRPSSSSKDAQGARAWITQFYLQLHRCLPLSCKRSPDGASTDWGGGHLIAAYYSFIYHERMKGWVGLVGWPIQRAVYTQVVIRQLQVERRTGKVRRSKTNVLPLPRNQLC